ncbi:hypothetical protein CDD80_5455 [Ophiocordyceps camponoti-rufipedis]|uniref:Cell surface protein n=1 Tax=Ophiocordyceps camponoti-rufipedis TaxID=2004952 RepID=A0A2C5ZIY7_9HYPO|nr:hypothetical protein CDD80_5455 [Ophiocordyceps camponoti-rufipedis]
MRYAIVSAALIVGASAHGLPVSVTGANGVTMPGLSVTDGTPRDCSTNGCGSQADTTILRDREMKQMPLGKTQGNGKVDAASAIANFMGMSKSAQSNKGSKGVGQEDDIKGLNQAKQKRLAERDLFIRGLVGNLINSLGGGGAGATGGKGEATAKGQKNVFAAESAVSDSMGIGADKGLPDTDNQGNFNVIYRQINQDGAGPLTMECDATSCGTDNNAFQKADINTNVPGAFLGLSAATNTEFAMNASLPQGMVCKGSCGGAQNVCVCRMRNNTPAGPFGGSVAVTQNSNAVKRAVAYRLKKRYEILRREQGIKKTADKRTADEAIKTNSLEKRFELASQESAQDLAAADNEEQLSDEAEAKLQKRFQLASTQSSQEDLEADKEEALSDGA